jgi:hypothetical protein
MRAQYRSGVPDAVNTYNVPITSTSSRIPVAFELWDRDTGLYIQDKWAATRRLTVNAGVRFETNFGWQPAGCRAANTFVPETCWDEIKGNPDFKGIVPRASVIYDLKGDGRTAIKFAASRYDQPINISINQRLNPVGTTNDSRPWTACTAGKTSACDLNGDLIPQLNELDKLLTRNRIWVDRTRDLGHISKEDAIAYALTGPNIRGSGIDYDVRKAKPYLDYEKYEFDIPVGTVGDAYDRYLVRFEEMRPSLNLFGAGL